MEATEIFDFAAALGAEMDRSLTAWETSALILLHELRHVRGAPQETPSQRKMFNTEIVEKCSR